MKTRVLLVLAALLAGCQQSGGNTPSITSASATVQTKANYVFDAVQAAFPLVYTNTTSNYSAAAGQLTATGTYSPSGTYPFNQTVTMIDYDPTGLGYPVGNDVVIKGNLLPSGSGSYTYVGDLFLEGTHASGAVSLNLSVRTANGGTNVTYSGTVTVDGTEYTYAGSQ